MTAARAASIALVVLTLVGCRGHGASQPTETSVLAGMVSVCGGSSGTIRAGDEPGQIVCDGPATPLPSQQAAVAEIKRYLHRHPPNEDVRSMACRRGSEAVTCTIALSHGCKILGVQGPSSNPWVVPGLGACTKVK